MKNTRPLYRFHYRFADGSTGGVTAYTPGDARAQLKRIRKRLPKVVEKWREVVEGTR